MAAPRELEQRVLRFVAGEAVLRDGERVLLLLSGGADSMAMLALVRLVDRRLGLALGLRALHVDYGLRGAASTRDREIVERGCAAAGVELETVRLEGKLCGVNFQARARSVRYERARALCAAWGCDAIAVAHNRDDQAETVLYRLAKYASPQALAGMRPREGDGADGPALARPLLCLGAGEVRRYCAARAIAYGEDATNAAPVYARNVLRLDVLPRLRQINPRVSETLAASAELAAAQDEVLAEAVERAWGRAERPAGEGEIALAVDALAAEKHALRLLCLRELAARSRAPGALVERNVVAGMERLLERADEAGRMTLAGGWEVARGGGLLLLRRRRAPHACAPVEVVAENEEQAALQAGVDFCGRHYSAELVRGPLQPLVTSGGILPPAALQAWVAMERPPRRVVLRHPRRGDRFQPLGQRAATTVARFLAAARVLPDDRARALVVEVDGVVAWVGFARGWERLGRVAQPRRVSESTALTFHLTEEDA